MGLRAPTCLLALAVLASTSAAATAEPRVEPSRPGSNFHVLLEPLFLQTDPATGGSIRLSFDDDRTSGTDLSLYGGNGIANEAFAPRMSFGWRWNFPSGLSLGGEARFTDLKEHEGGPARLAPGTTAQQNFATTNETGDLKLYTGDLEAVAAYSRWGFTLEGSLGSRSGHFAADALTEAWGVFTSGNYVQVRLANGSSFRGTGNVQGYRLAYRVPQAPVSVFVGRRFSILEGKSDSYASVAGSVASSTSAPLVGAARVQRNGVSSTELTIGETRFGVQADFGAPEARFRSFARLTYEKADWALDGPPTGGAGFGGTIGNLTTNSFSSAGLGGAALDGWSLAIGTAF